MESNKIEENNLNQTVEEQENVITMVDVLEEQKGLEEDANAVLGGSDDKNCTYLKGYISRQALYACQTCTPSSNAGICLACSYHCHEGHELVELYTKRNFRCDCGNSLFPNNNCNLDSIKDPLNENNEYNQNFSGVYCSCKRPYPDPEDTVDDEMIQCIICEDWYHGRHLGTKLPEEHNYAEMVCLHCMKKVSFLRKYKDLLANHTKNNEESEVNVEKIEDTTNSCYLTGKDDVEHDGTTFWIEGWRKSLCRCTSCIEMYNKLKVNYLLEESDTVQYYESKSKTQETQYEQGMKALSALDRVQQVEAIHGYNNMKTALKDYLQKFAENKKVVREEDIKEFFSQMEAKKKQKVDVPHFCR